MRNFSQIEPNNKIIIINMKVFIAFITNGSPDNQKGMFNNVQERASRLIDVQDGKLNIDFYMIRHRDSLLFSLIRRKSRPKRISYAKVGNVRYKYLWVKHTFYDYILTTRYKKRPIFDKKYIDRHIDSFSEYDLIAAHGISANYLAYAIHEKHKTPYITSWHGSDINLAPHHNKEAFALTKDIIEKASMNLIVSKALLKTSDKITTSAQKQVLYTGPAAHFSPVSSAKKKEIKEKYGAKNKKVIGFIGNFVPVKNIGALPEIYKELARKRDDIIFWIVGDGPLENQLQEALDSIHANYKMFGKLEPPSVPEVLNGMDVLLLPSLNEGLPRVTLEALACQVPVVRSNVGGIPEVIEENNTFGLDDNFTIKISNRILEIIENEELSSEIPQEFSWKKSIDYLTHIFKESINKYNDKTKNFISDYPRT